MTNNDDGSVTIKRGRLYLPDNDEAPNCRLIVYSRHPGIIVHMAPDLSCDTDGQPIDPGGDCDGPGCAAVERDARWFERRAAARSSR